MSPQQELRLRRFVREAYKQGWLTCVDGTQAGSREEARAVIEKVAREVTATEIMNWILREMPNLTPDDYSSVSNVVRDAMTEEVLPPGPYRSPSLI
jgi:hypothetical protein